MTTQFIVGSVEPLPNGQVMLSGTYGEAPLAKGMRGHAAASSGDVQVEVVGIGIVNPDLVDDNRQGVLVTLLRGDAQGLEGMTLRFE